MPVYNLACMMRPTVERAALASFMKKLGTAIHQQGGILMDITSHGLTKVRALTHFVKHDDRIHKFRVHIYALSSSRA
jgi:ribosomal protein S6